MGIEEKGAQNADVKKIAEILANLTIKDACELSAVLAEMGIKPSSGQTIVQPVVPAGEETHSEEKKSFNLVLKNVGASKVQVMRLCKDLFSIDLMAAKKLVETPGSTIKENVSKEEADKIIEQFKGVGAEVVAE